MRLAQAGSPTPGLDAEVLLRHILGIDRTALFVRRREPITAETLAIYGALLEERARGVPVAYLTGEREFMGVVFEVGPGVLVPRPETELLVTWAVSWIRACDQEQIAVVDLGTGSGAIAIGISAEIGPNWRGHIIASDISRDAISIAARNRARLDTHHRVALVQGSLSFWLGGPVDLILANLPYLRPEQIVENPPLAAEPQLALDGGADGLDLIRRLIEDAPRVLAPGGAIGLEIDPSQRDSVVSMARREFPTSVIQILPDLAGFDRHVTIQTISG